MPDLRTFPFAYQLAPLHHTPVVDGSASPDVETSSTTHHQHQEPPQAETPARPGTHRQARVRGNRGRHRAPSRHGYLRRALARRRLGASSGALARLASGLWGALRRPAAPTALDRRRGATSAGAPGRAGWEADTVELAPTGGTQ